MTDSPFTDSPARPPADAPAGPSAAGGAPPQGGAHASPFIVTLDERNFMQVVVEGSDTHPVLVDFWADWCGPCKALSPILEKLAIEFNGAFTLAMLDTEAQPGIAQQLGIRSLPTVKLFRNRQIVDEFMGALPEAELRRFLETHVGEPLPMEEVSEPVDDRVENAMALFEAGRADEARAALSAAREADPANPEILFALGQMCVSMGDLEMAEECLGALPEEVKDGAQAKRLGGILALAKDSDGSADLPALEAALLTKPGDSATLYRLAIGQALAGDVQSGMDHLLTLVRNDPDHAGGAPRTKLLALFDVLGDDPLVGKYRRKLFALLH